MMAAQLVTNAPRQELSDFAVGISAAPKQQQEHEIVLLSPLTLFLQKYDTLSLPRVDITQVYFKQRVVHELAALVLDRIDDPAEHRPEDFKRARVREICGPQSAFYRLEVKGPKSLTPAGVFSRIELGVTIDAEEFAELLLLPSKGFTMKSRYAVPFEIHTDRNAVRAVANPDLIRATGEVRDGVLQPRNGIISLPPFVLTDIEFTDLRHAQAFRSGRHTFALAHQGAIEVASLPQATQKALSASRMAKNGFDRGVESIIRKLQAA